MNRCDYDGTVRFHWLVYIQFIIAATGINKVVYLFDVCV